MTLSIAGFWRACLIKNPAQPVAPLPGWSFAEPAVKAFTEAPLEWVDADGGSATPETSNIMLVSAPGAVGKSTLARQIAHETGAVYVNLADCGPVGDMYVTGGLATTGLLSIWPSSMTTLLIDGLDEARLRVTRDAFEAFLLNISSLAAGRALPVVMFGRTSAIIDSAKVLARGPATWAVAELGFYPLDKATEFVERLLTTDKPDAAHRSVEVEATRAILARLAAITVSDGARFAGYAPVLRAVATYVARARNPSALLASVEAGTQPITLHDIAVQILVRDRSKLAPLSFQDPSLLTKLYSPDEQLDRCVTSVFGAPPPPLPMMSQADAQTYEEVVRLWMMDHPFLNGGRPSSAVFGAMISTRALKREEAASVALDLELQRGAAANPFLHEFYFDKPRPTDAYMPPEHVGMFYASLRAGLAIGDTARLQVEGAEMVGGDGADPEVAFSATVSITVRKVGQEFPDVRMFRSSQLGTLRLPGQVGDVDVTAPYCTVQIGPQQAILLSTPVSVVCHRLVLKGDSLVVELGAAATEDAAYFEADEFDALGGIATVPTLRGEAELRVSWPGNRQYPWTTFAIEPKKAKDPRVDEALRRFRRIVMAFRSHSKGSLARLDDKLEHARMAKGYGEEVLRLLVKDGVIQLQGVMYYLDPDRLGTLVGATYTQCVTKQYSQKTMDYIAKAV